MRKALPFLLGAGLVLLAQTSWSQRTAPWRVYKMADGLSEPGCASVTVGPRGKVLARHLTRPYLVELDGFNIRSIPAPGGTQTRTYQSPSGQIWTATTNGLYEYRSDTWIFHAVPEIALAFRTKSPLLRQVPLWPVRQGLVIFLLPDKLMEFNVDAPNGSATRPLLDVSRTRLNNFLGMCLARGGGLWISGSTGLAKVVPPLRGPGSEAQWQEFLIPDALKLRNLVEPREDELGAVTMLSDSLQGTKRSAVRFDGQNWSSQPLSPEGINLAWRSSDRSTWAINASTLFESSETSDGAMTVHEDVSAREYFDAASESRGAFWLATSDGLYRYSPALWRTPGPLRNLANPIHCLMADENERLWFVAGTALHFLRGGEHLEFALPTKNTRPLQQVMGHYLPRLGRLVFEIENELYAFDLASSAFKSFGGSTPYHALGSYRDEGLCVHSASEAPAVPSTSRLEIFDGTELRPLVDVPPELGQKQSFYEARNGDFWLGGENGVACYHNQQWQTFVSPDRTTPESGTCFAELADGKVWCATVDKIWEYDGRNWSILRGGIDRIETMVRSRDGSVWVGSNSGLYRYSASGGTWVWVENSVEDGLLSPSIRVMLEDSHGQIWAGTTFGLSLFHPEADKDSPQTTIEELGERQKKIPESGSITISFEGRDKWKFTSRHRLLFSYRLDERDWSEFGELNRVTFSDLSAGNHYFQVRSMDRNGNIDPKPATTEFAVILPWFKESRLLGITAAGLATALFFAGLAFNRHRRLVRSYAEVERKVAERTHELELANRELMHSQKMTALGTLAAGIAHDFNNILSIIKGSAQIIEANLENHEKVRTRVDRINMVVDQGAGIVKAMLGFSRDSQAQKGMCDVNEVVHDTLRLLGDRFLRDVQVTVQNAADLPKVSASKDFIQQILLNFIFNAAEAITDRNEIILATAKAHKLRSDLVMVPAHVEEYVTISVKDFGCGIAPEILPRIFEPFFTTKAFSTRRGTGLGLSMVYQLAEKLEAGLAVNSAPNEGSVFTLILPAKTETEAKKADL
jgi:signal transduction histidine kinase